MVSRQRRRSVNELSGSTRVPFAVLRDARSSVVVGESPHRRVFRESLVPIVRCPEQCRVKLSVV